MSAVHKLILVETHKYNMTIVRQSSGSLSYRTETLRYPDGLVQM